MSEQTVLSFWLRLSLQPRLKPQTKRFKPKPRIYLGNARPGVYLTKREAECAYCLMTFMKRSAIAKRLALSRRTIDTYIESAKKKLDCHSHQELLDELHKTDFMKNIEKLDLK